MPYEVATQHQQFVKLYTYAFFQTGQHMQQAFLNLAPFQANSFHY